MKLIKLREIWSLDYYENHENYCHQMSHFMAKMHKMRYRLGFAPDPARGAYSAPTGPVAWFKGPYF